MILMGASVAQNGSQKRILNKMDDDDFCVYIYIYINRRKRPLGRLKRRWVDNIKIDLREIGWGGMGWMDLAQDRDQWRALVNTVMNLWVS
jgi:hypothetical protein